MPKQCLGSENLKTKTTALVTIYSLINRQQCPHNSATQSTKQQQLYSANVNTLVCVQISVRSDTQEVQLQPPEFRSQRTENTCRTWSHGASAGECAAYMRKRLTFPNSLKAEVAENHPGMLKLVSQSIQLHFKHAAGE